MTQPQRDHKSTSRSEIYEAVLNDRHCTDPKVGDTWSERGSVVMVVLEVAKDKVVVVKEKIEHPNNTYSLDLHKPETWTRDRLNRYPRYGSPDLYVDINGLGYPKCWCHVSPRASMDIVAVWNTLVEEGLSEELELRLSNVIQADGTPLTLTPTRDNYR